MGTAGCQTPRATEPTGGGGANNSQLPKPWARSTLANPSKPQRRQAAGCSNSASRQQPQHNCSQVSPPEPNQRANPARGRSQGRVVPPTPIQNNGDPDSTSSARAQIPASSISRTGRGQRRGRRRDSTDHPARSRAARLPQANQRASATGRLSQAGTPIQVSGCRASNQRWLIKTASSPQAADQRGRSTTDQSSARAGTISRGPPRDGATPARTPPNRARDPACSW